MCGWHDAVGADKASECRIVIPRIIEQQARAVIVALVGAIYFVVLPSRIAPVALSTK